MLTFQVHFSREEIKYILILRLKTITTIQSNQIIVLGKECVWKYILATSWLFSVNIRLCCDVIVLILIQKAITNINISEKSTTAENQIRKVDNYLRSFVSK